MIVAVTILAVLTVYVIHLPDEIHHFAILRSIGSTKSQLTQLAATESLLLAIPAVVLGIPCGMACTKFALWLLVHYERTSIRVSIPYKSLLIVTLLWAAAIVLARCVMLVVVTQMPLTGQMQLQIGKANRIKRLRSGMIALLFVAFGLIVVYTKMEALSPESSAKSYQQKVHYAVERLLVDEEGTATEGLVSEQEADFFRQIPGVSLVFETTSLQTGISFSGMEERTARFVALDGQQWADVFDLEEDELEAFNNGEMVLVCVPGADVPNFYLSDGTVAAEDRVFVLPQEDISSRDYVLPSGNVTLHIYNNDGASIRDVPTAAAVRCISLNTIWDSSGLTATNYWDPYTVVCSQQFLENLLSELPEGEQWGPFEAGGEFGYTRISIHLSTYANMTAADSIVSAYCAKNDLMLGNYRQDLTTRETNNNQKIILLYAAGVCIALISLLILATLLSLEKEQEMHSFRILRALGMSARQLRAKQFGKALGRSVLTAVGGWLLYVGYNVHYEIQWEATAQPDIGHEARKISVLDSLRVNLANWIAAGCTMRLVVILTAICFLVALVVSLFSTCTVRKEEWNV